MADDLLIAPEESRLHPARFLDGTKPVPAKATVWIDPAKDALVVDTDGTQEIWPLPDIRRLPDQADRIGMVLRLRGDPLRRLFLADRSLLPDLPRPNRRAPVTQRGKLFAWAAAALCSVALIVFVLVPVMANQLAEFIPPEGEKALGDVTLEQIREALGQSQGGVQFCTSEAGRDALETMQTRLTDTMAETPDLTVHVLNHPMVNAFALPGGNIVFFRGLIDKAETPEEVAAVFAHEIGHVVSRDPTRHALRSAGSLGVLGLLFGDFAGGTLMLFLTEQLIEAQYSQRAESEADEFAYDMLTKADLSPDALAVMFERFRSLGGEPTGIEEHFMSHPALGDRIDNARAAVPAGFTPRPLLTDAEWNNLQTVCNNRSTDKTLRNRN